MRDELTPHHDDLDALLDAALATYANPEPSPGLTARILAETRAANRDPSIRWMIWAIPALAALLAVVILLPTRHIYRDPPPSSLQLSGSASTPPPTAPKLPVKTGLDRAAPRSRAIAVIHAPTPAPEPLPKQEVFPTPTPLSHEEQALVAEVSRDPERVAKQVAQSAGASEDQPIEPLRIAAIHIPPLNPPDNGAN